MPTVTIEELLERNRAFAGPGHTPRPLIRNEATIEGAHTIVISCFDDRAAPESFLQINTHGREVVSIRNAGGHTRHCVHYILALDGLLRIDEVIVVHHQDCGLTYMTNEDIRQRLRERVGSNEAGKESIDFENFDFVCMTDEDSIKESCRDDV
ncbi:hypothetical protein EAF04_004564 [Stromatinia cepivora]|nr:hypothetical protein EAF04_004564 [Stromatinia cepivora]